MTRREEHQSEEAPEREALLKVRAISDREIAPGQTCSFEEVIAELRNEGLDRDDFLLR